MTTIDRLAVASDCKPTTRRDRLMLKSRLTAIAGVTTAMFAATALAASPAGAVTSNGPGICTPTGCTCTPTTCKPIPKPPPKPYPMSSCFSINAITVPTGGTGLRNELIIQGQCFVAGSTAVVSVTKDVSGLPTTTQRVPVAADGTFTTALYSSADFPLNRGTYNIWSYDWIGPEWISPMSNQVQVTFS